MCIISFNQTTPSTCLFVICHPYHTQTNSNFRLLPSPLTHHHLPIIVSFFLSFFLFLSFSFSFSLAKLLIETLFLFLSPSPYFVSTLFVYYIQIFLFSRIVVTLSFFKVIFMIIQTVLKLFLFCLQ